MNSHVVEGFECPKGFLSIPLDRAGERLDADERGDGLGAEVDEAKGGDAGFVVCGAVGGFQSFQETGGGDVQELDLGGEVGQRLLVEDAALAFTEEVRVEAVLVGVVVAGLASPFLVGFSRSFDPPCLWHSAQSGRDVSGMGPAPR